ncbi:MAG: P-loop NTPase fold protein [Pseudomonadales bacterium]|jgi:hypothetical protein|nr:P-loop NTPase fold protein [Pseudomonadales bacterium]
MDSPAQDPAERSYTADEPTASDSLNRDQYAEALAQLCRGCATPLAVGIYATWGVGKTSLMQRIHSKLDPARYHVVWFNLWAHQNVENPVVAFAQTFAASIPGYESNRNVRKLVTLVAAAFGNRVSQAATGMSLLDLLGLGKSHEEQAFEARDDALRLGEHLQELVRDALRATGRERVVCFIDDLDRCTATKGLEMLDALKLYLNVEDCIYFLGVDRQALQQSVDSRYAGTPTDTVSYLDKIIQLPFTVPPIARADMHLFIDSLLPSQLGRCREQLAEGLGDNPRQVKRFINTLALNHNLASQIENYDEQVLCALLMIQYRNQELYELVSARPSLIIEMIASDEEGQKLRGDHLEDDDKLEAVLDMTPFPSDPGGLDDYFNKTDVAGIVPEEPGELSIEQPGQSRISLIDQTSSGLQSDERPWRVDGFLTDEQIEHAVLAQAQPGARVVDRLLLYRPRAQRTWLVVTDEHLYCLLDDQRTRAGNRVVQWREPLEAVRSVQAYESKQGRPVVDIGSHKRWLYSRRLYPSAEALETAIGALIERALAS